MTTETAPKPETAIGERKYDGKRYLTVEEWERAAKLEAGEKVYRRKKGRLERHRIVSITPQFSGVTGTDVQSVPKDENNPDSELMTVIFCVPRLYVEKFEIVESMAGDEKVKSKRPLSAWFTDALKFLDEFEVYPED